MDANSAIPSPMPHTHIIDTHAHLDSYEDIDAVLKRAQNKGVEKIIAASFDKNSSRFNKMIVEKYDNTFIAPGIHPNNASELNTEAKTEIASIAKNNNTVAVGETGLDYYRLHSTKEEQEEAFRWHIELANNLNLPLMVHSREAIDESLEILKAEGWPKAGFVFHAFSGNYEQAKEIFEAGGLISVTGVVTFKNAPELHKLVAKIDISKMMLETDSPYLCPEPYRGKTNEPANTVFVAKKIAELKNISYEEVANKTTKTAKKFFKI